MPTWWKCKCIFYLIYTKRQKNYPLTKNKWSMGLRHINYLKRKESRERKRERERERE